MFSRACALGHFSSVASCFTSFRVISFGAVLSLLSSVWAVVRAFLIPWCRGAMLIAAGLLPGGCNWSEHNMPVNEPASGQVQTRPLFGLLDAETDGDTLIFLSFSGGGTRAAAFADGALRALNEHELEVGGERKRMIEKVKFLSGVSGGSIPAAHFGLYGPAGIYHFRERFLIQNAQESIGLSVSLRNALNLFLGGVNNPSHLAEWFDENLFFGAKMKDLLKPESPVVLIAASDIRNRTPFIFSPLVFGSFCSDFNNYPVAWAVTASSSVPFVFKPVVLEAYPRFCEQYTPVWLQPTYKHENLTENITAFLESLAAYREGEDLFIKLLDGGVTDNLALHAFLLGRADPSAPYRPLTREAAVKTKRIVYFAIDVGQAERGNWHKTLKGPKIKELFGATLSTAILSNDRNSFDLLQDALDIWERDLIQYRCSLSAKDVRRIRGYRGGWDCRDIDVQLERLSFASFPPQQKDFLNQIPTSFDLPEETVDYLIWAGYTALRQSDAFQALDPSPVFQ